MQKSDFAIGAEFYTETGRWRCTDIGTRVIVAIPLGPHEIVTLRRGSLPERSMTNESDWRNGPPYAVAEEVFDEDDMIGCAIDESEL